MNGDGTERRILTGTQETIVTDPQWSPDGGRIIYRSNNSLRTLKVVDIESGAVEVLAIDLDGRAFWDLSP
jgi:Tol biopolymer transport system component